MVAPSRELRTRLFAWSYGLYGYHIDLTTGWRVGLSLSLSAYVCTSRFISFAVLSSTNLPWCLRINTAS